MITTLRIKKKYSTRLDVAIRWYSIISVLNNFKWSPQEIKLLAYMAIEGSISSGGKKEGFCKKFSCPRNSIYNITRTLKDKGVLIKKEGKIVIHPQLLMNFSYPLLIQLNIDNEETKS